MRSLKRDLFERHLWPLAVVIIAAIVALPFLLHAHHANADIPVPPTAQGASSTPTAGKSDQVSAHHRVAPTSSTRDPFEVAGAGKASKNASSTSTTSTTSTTATTTPPASASTSGTGVGTSGTTPSSPASETTPGTTTPAATTAPVTTAPGTTSHSGSATVSSWDIYSVDLRIGAPGAPVSHHNIARLTPLPTERSPQIMYMGVTDRGRAAVFALGAGVVVRPLQGDRSTGAFCHPSRVDCALAVIPAGKSVALLYVNSTGHDRAVVLRLSRIGSQVTQSPSVVAAARRHVSALGLCDLKLGDPIGFFDLTDDSVSIPSVAACRGKKLAVPFPGSLGAGSSVRG